MRKTFCDRCGFEIPAGTDAKQIAVGLHKDTGKMTWREVCESCADAWKDRIARFFSPQGQSR